MEPWNRIRYITYLACIVIEFTGDAISEEVLLEMNTMRFGLVKVNTSVNDWDRSFDCMRNKLTRLFELNLNETGTSGNFRLFQSNGTRCVKTAIKWLENPTFECGFREKCDNITDKCYSIVCLRPKNNCTLMSGCEGQFYIQWKDQSEYLSSSNLSNVCEETEAKKCFVHCYKQTFTRPNFSRNISLQRKCRKSMERSITFHGHGRNKGENEQHTHKIDTIITAVVVCVCLIIIALLVMVCLLYKFFKHRIEKANSTVTRGAVSQSSRGMMNTTQKNTNVSQSTTNICFDAEFHIYNDCSITDDLPSVEISVSSTSTNTSRYSKGSQIEQAKLKKATCDNANKDINEPDTTEYNRLRDQLRIDAVDYNCHIPDKSLISPRSSDIPELNSSDYTLAKDSQMLGKDTLTTSPYSLVKLVEPSNEPNFRFNQTDLAQNILLQQIERITIF
ncbi:hypothetical protein BgiMline_026724 [Biomphalaria glabrata]|nr:hypothetical protein BgiMline_021178 [Biomphalaria glabrata]